MKTRSVCESAKNMSFVSKQTISEGLEKDDDDGILTSLWDWHKYLHTMMIRICGYLSRQHNEKALPSHILGECLLWRSLIESYFPPPYAL